MKRTIPSKLNDDLILSVHIPKAAGISLGYLYEQAFGKDVVLDYPDRDCWKNAHPGVKAVHGHFELHEYLYLVKNPRVITFVREPLSRAISHFYFWKNPPPHVPTDHPLYIKHFVDREPSLSNFLLEPEMANMMTSFLRPFTHPEQFFFVGIFEHFEEEIACLRNLLGLPEKTTPRLNVGPPRDEWEVTAEVKKAFYELHGLDHTFYRDALALRERSR